MKKFIQIYKNLPVQMKASIWFLICSFIQKGISTITTPIFTRMLTTEEYGQYSVFTSWYHIIAPIVCLNLYSGVYAQGIVKYESERDSFSSSLQGLAFSLIALWAGLYFFTTGFWNSLLSLSTLEVIAMFFMIWTGGVFAFWSMNQRVDFKYKNLVIITMVASLLQPLLSILLILCSENKVLARIWGIVIVQLILYGWMFVSQIVKGKKFFSKKFWIYALKFNIPLLPHYLSMNILSGVDRIMIDKMVGAEQAGIYNLAYSISLIMTIFNTALLQTIEPWIYRKLKENRIDEISHVAYPCFLIIAGLNVLLIMFAPEVIAIFAPSSYREAIWVIPSVALSVFFMFLYTFFATFEFYYEKTKYIVSATAGGAILNILLNYFCIKRFGYIAAGYTTLFGYILFAILHYYYMRRICKLYLNNVKPYDWRIVGGIAVGSLIIGFSLMVTYKNSIVRYLFILVVFIVVFLLRKKVMDILKLIIDVKKNKN